MPGLYFLFPAWEQWRPTLMFYLLQRLKHQGLYQSEISLLSHFLWSHGKSKPMIIPLKWLMNYDPGIYYCMVKFIAVSFYVVRWCIFTGAILLVGIIRKFFTSSLEVVADSLTVFLRHIFLFPFNLHFCCLN